MQAQISSYYNVIKDSRVHQTLSQEKVTGLSHVMDAVHPALQSFEGFVDGHHSSSFDKLPIEMNQRIAELLDCDQDLENFRMSCPAAYYAVDGDGKSFWRRRFLDNFDQSESILTNNHFKKEYIWRKKILNNGAVFRQGHSKKEIMCLDVLWTLIIEAFSGKIPHAGHESENIKQLIRFAKNHNILLEIFNPHHAAHYHHQRDAYRRPVDPYLHMIQVILAPVMFSLDINNDVYRFPESQQVAYANSMERPIFIGSNGLTIDQNWLLHQLNFWKYHLTRPEEITLYSAYNALDESEKPRFWNKQLRSSKEPEIGRQWKGAYAFVDRDEIIRIRSHHGEEDLIQDEFNGDETQGLFQDMTLSLNINREESWNPVFESVLHSLSKPKARRQTRAQKRSGAEEIFDWKPCSFRFTGDGADNEESFLADGWLNPLPSQHGVPGWQRMTMMKYFEENGSIDYDALWAYEGIVLPGGQIIVGRWWCPSDGIDENMYSGPFIHWCVDSPKCDTEDELENSKKP